ncbi:MAG: phage tail sheath family protein, partial [Acidimicrobiales bacterium]
MATITAPGVYVLEEDPGPRPIESVGTNIAAFLGVAPASEERLQEIVPVTNWTEFRKHFVDPASDDGQRPPSTDLTRAVAGFFQNGGGLCLVVNLGADPAPNAVTEALRLLEARDEVSILAAPGMADPATHEALIGHCEILQDRFVILDPAGAVDDTADLLTVATSAAPRPRSSSSSSSSASSSDSSPSDAEESDDADATAPPATPRIGKPRETESAAYYYPRIGVTDPLDGTLTITPPSGHIAGVYARVDERRGVHKAPANEPIVGAITLEDFVTKAEQGPLNAAGVNVIRSFPRQGIRIWGARTLAPAGPNIYVNVRRLVIMIKESIEEGTMWVVFEPNDYRLWKSITRDAT